jgi:hypothetical protein
MLNSTACCTKNLFSFFITDFNENEITESETSIQRAELTICKAIELTYLGKRRIITRKYMKPKKDKMCLNQTSSKMFRCSYHNCGKTYKSKENLTLHIKNKHLKI